MFCPETAPGLPAKPTSTTTRRVRPIRVLACIFLLLFAGAAPGTWPGDLTGDRPIQPGRIRFGITAPPPFLEETYAIAHRIPVIGFGDGTQAGQVLLPGAAGEGQHPGNLAELAQQLGVAGIFETGSLCPAMINLFLITW